LGGNVIIEIQRKNNEILCNNRIHHNPPLKIKGWKSEKPGELKREDPLEN